MYSRALLACAVLLSTWTTAQQPSAPVSANSNSVYQQLRHIKVSSEAVSVSNLVLKRDAATFTFEHGVFVFLPAVAGKITGAVFMGEGGFSLLPPLEMERRSLHLLTKEEPMAERFSNLVLRFTDNTAAEIRATGTVTRPGAGGDSLLSQSQEACRKKLHVNLEARILQDVLSDGPGGLFVAFIAGRRYNSKLLLTIDPHGDGFVAPEEISLRTYDENKWGIWAAFHYTQEYATGAASGTQANASIHIEHQKLDTRIDRGGYLRGKAGTTFVAGQDSLRLVPLELFPSLRVQQVTDASGQPLEFIQEDKKEDADFWVILPRALARGEKFTVETVYEGKDAVINEDGGNYFPVARTDWYPASSGDYATYEMTFAVPRGMTLVATGTLVKEYAEGDQNITVWKSDTPEWVAGFNFGKFKVERATVKKLGFEVESYANSELPAVLKQLQHLVTAPGLGGVTGPGPSAEFQIPAFGAMSTTAMMKKPLAEAEIAVELYTRYFGPPAYHRLAMTQQTACNFGQSWPELVYLPVCSFLDDTYKHQLGLRDFRGYWRVVAPHEVAHQWWGHTVGWNSYRDQWMSEGFADFSASLFIQSVWNKPQEFLHFWKDERELLTEKNKDGFRPIEVGPVTMGYRLNSTRTGFDVARRLIYPKGAYILHMIRMMMWQSGGQDAAFQRMMTDFVHTYSNRAASTEDFKAMVEKHMTPAMDVSGNHKMDWFFDEFVYGTALPSYSLDYSFAPGSDGMVLKFKATQANVSDRFVMPVPLYVELADGRVVQVGRITLNGASSYQDQVTLRGMKEKPRRAMLNYYGDVLAAE